MTSEPSKNRRTRTPDEPAPGAFHFARASVLAWLGNRKKVKVSERKIHPLTLGVVAAIIRRHDSRHRVRIVNQAHEAIPWDEPCDLVGITVNTYTAPIAGEIAARFRQRGVPVIMGGPHASLAPEACRSCADAVVTGEAERRCRSCWMILSPEN